MRLPEGVEWALHCTWLLTVARDRDALPARRLAEFYGLPEAYLAKLLKTLVRAGLLSATSGPRGGFRLARPPGDITVADVVEAVPAHRRGLPPALRHRPGYGPGRAGLAAGTGRHHDR
jgi:Rrf2 family protein